MEVLLTGGSGFLGKTIYQKLNGHQLISLARNNADIICDLSKAIPTNLPKVDLVIHAAGKAHMIPKTEAERQLFFDVNVTGTRNLLTGLQNLAILPKAFLFISTVAVYGLESGELINEDHPLLATDPYGQSKIQAEQMIQTWCKQNNVNCAMLRLPLIAGANPPGNLKSMINGIKKGYYFNIAGGQAKKSMVLAEDVAQLIPRAAKVGGVYNLTDRYHPSFAELAVSVSQQLNKPKPANIPLSLARVIGKIGDLLGKKAPINTNKLNKMITDLTFDDSRAVSLLGWQPAKVLEGFKIE